MSWSKSVRAIHWLVAICVILNLFIVEEGDDPHNWIGYVACAAVLFRFGILFRTRTFSVVNNWAKTVYILIWTSVIALGISGFMMELDAFWGDELLEQIHAQISNVILGLVVIHLIGIAADAIKFKRKTWLAMITGTISKN